MVAVNPLPSPQHQERPYAHAMANTGLPASDGLTFPSYTPHPSHISQLDPGMIEDRQSIERDCIEALTQLYRGSANWTADEPAREHVSPQQADADDKLDIHTRTDCRIALPPISHILKDVSLAAPGPQSTWKTSRHSSFSSASTDWNPTAYDVSPISPSGSVFCFASGCSSTDTHLTSSWVSQTSFRDPFQAPECPLQPTIYLSQSFSQIAPPASNYLPQQPEERSRYPSRYPSPELEYVHVRQEPCSFSGGGPRRSSSLSFDSSSESFVNIEVRPNIVRPKTKTRPNPKLKVGLGTNDRPSKKPERTNGIWAFKNGTPKRAKRSNVSYTFEQSIFLIYHKVDLDLDWHEVTRRFQLWFLDNGPARSEDGLTCEYYRTNKRIPYVREDGLLDLGPFRRNDGQVSRNSYQGVKYRLRSVKCRDDAQTIPLSERFPEEILNPRNLWVLPEHREDPEIIRLATMRKAQREHFLRLYPQVINP